MGQNTPKPEEEKEEKKLESTVKFVRAATVQNQAYQVEINSLGRVSSSQAISIGSEVQGILRAGSVKLKKGASFRSGDVLFRINNGDAALMLKARKSSYLTLLATTLPDIKIDYPEHYEVWKLFFDKLDMDQPFPPMPPLVDSKLKTLLASRNILGEYYNIKADEVKLSKYVVRAPFNGTITEAFADVGSLVGPGGAIVNIINNGSLEVECPVSPEEIDLVRIGTSVELSDETGTMWNGKVIRKGQYLNPNTQSIPVFIAVSEKDKKLYNGMYLTAEIEGDSVPNVFEIPRRALLENEPEVYLVKDSSLVKTKIDLVLLRDETALIGGVENGSKLVTEPLVNVRQNTKVAIIKK